MKWHTTLVGRQKGGKMTIKLRRHVVKRRGFDLRRKVEKNSVYRERNNSEQLRWGGEEPTRRECWRGKCGAGLSAWSIIGLLQSLNCSCVTSKNAPADGPRR